MTKVKVMKIGANVASMLAGVVLSKILHSMMPETNTREKNNVIYETDGVSK